MKEELFKGKVKIFPDGWYYVEVPTKNSNKYVAYTKRGNIAINAIVGNSVWPTLLWGFGDNTFFITIPAKVRKKENINENDQIKIKFGLRLSNDKTKK